MPCCDDNKKYIIDKGIYTVSMIVLYLGGGARDIDYIRSKREGDRYVLGNVVDVTVAIKNKNKILGGVIRV